MTTSNNEIESMEHNNFAIHICALRTCVIKSLCALVITTLISYIYADYIFEILAKPLIHLFSKEEDSHRLIYTNLTEAFLTYIKVAFFSGFSLSFPYIALQIWQFVSPGLYKSEKVLFRFLLLSVPIFFILGAVFAYTTVIPSAFRFFLSFETTIGSIPLQLETKISEYLSLVMRLILAFGICFQLPVVLASLAWLGIVTKKTLVNGWRYAVVGVTVISAIITPPDAISMIMLAVPMLILYTISIIIVKHIEQRKNHARH